MKRLFRYCLLIAVVPLIAAVFGPGNAGADTFTPNNLIYDGVFDDTGTMNAAQIDNWLNSSFGSTSCISTAHGFSAPDPTGYNPTNGFIFGGNVSAGQVIYDAAQAYGINPQVLLTTLQKEQSLVSGNAGCSTLRYAGAMGYGCPDGGTTYSYSGVNLYSINGVAVTSVSGTCVNTSLKVGFSQQVIRAAWLLKFGEQRSEGNVSWAVIKGNWNNSDDPQSCYSGPMTQGTFARCPSGGSAYYDGYTTIDGTSVHMDDGATAALYWYTPHFTGNQNFDTIFTTWFGPTSNPNLYYALIQGPNSPALYLETGAGKYYIPSGAIEQDWGLSNLPIQQVTQTYLDNLPTHNWVGHLLEDQWGNLFMVENGTLHYIRDASYLPLWGMSINDAVQSTGLAYSMPGTSWVGRFAQDASQPNGPIYLMDKGQKDLIPTSMLYEWRYTPDQLTTVSTTYLSGLTTGSTVTPYATDGTNNYVVDTGQKLTFANADIQNAYYGSNTPVSYDPTTLAMLPSAQASQFVIDPTSGAWYMLENGNKHYITKGDIATMWGRPANQPLTVLSPVFIASLPAAGNLAYVVQNGSPATYWLIDGTKHLISGNATAAWIASGVTPPQYSAQSLGLLTRGADATTAINAPGSPYTYTMDSGVRHWLQSSSVRSAWNDNGVLSVSSQLINVTPEGSYASYAIKSSAGQGYLLMNGALYPIDSNFYDVWGINSSTLVVSDQVLARFTNTGTTLKSFITINGTSYVMTGGSKAPISQYADAYVSSGLNPVTLPSDYFPTTAQASYLVRSAAGGNQIWLVTNGKKIALNFEQAVTYGYLSRGVQPTSLSPATLALIPDDTRTASLLIQEPGSGIKFLSFGSALGFPDGPTLISYISTSNPILVVSPSIFNTFALRGSVTRLIRDDAGNLFWMDSGSKHYILNGTILSHYPPTPQAYLEGTTQYLIPSGSNAQ